MVIRGPSQPARSVSISRRTLRYVALGACAILLFVLASFAALGLKLGGEAEAFRLAQQNELLSSNLERMQDKVTQLTESLKTLSERDRRFRLLAGLPEIDPEVRQVGIGGPGSGSIEESPLFALDEEQGAGAFGTTSDLNRLLRQANLLQVSLAEASRAMESYRDHLASYPSIDPVDGWISSRFTSSRYHPLLNIRRPHEGLDITAWPGTPVLATADGEVSFAGWRPGFGYTVEIDHGNGLKTRYAHNQKNLKVRVGDKVRRGDVIAQVGSTGLSNGPHVHYEVIKDGKAVNPEDYRLENVIVE